LKTFGKAADCSRTFVNALSVVEISALAEQWFTMASCRAFCLLGPGSAIPVHVMIFEKTMNAQCAALAK
jgi:hypothetical protein